MEARWRDWDRFVEANPAGGFMQTSWWADFRAESGYRHFGALVSRNGAVLGGALVMKLYEDDGSFFYYVPEGPLLPADGSQADAVFEAFLESVERDRRAESGIASHLRIEPRWTAVPGFMRGFRAVPEFADRYMEPRNTLCIDLRLSQPELLAQMKSKGRYNIQLARRHGVTVAEDSSEGGMQSFLEIYREMTERQGLRGKPHDYFSSLLESLRARGLGTLFFAEREGRRLAAALVIFFGGRATYFFGASRSVDRHVMAPYLLHFEIMCRARELGCSCYDFWGIAPSGASEHPWADISTFKRKFGGRELNLVPALDYVFDDAAYDRYCAAEAASG